MEACLLQCIRSIRLHFLELLVIFFLLLVDILVQLFENVQQMGDPLDGIGRGGFLFIGFLGAFSHDGSYV
jgi:hypothetical protein